MAVGCALERYHGSLRVPDGTPGLGGVKTGAARPTSPCRWPTWHPAPPGRICQDPQPPSIAGASPALRFQAANKRHRTIPRHALGSFLDHSSDTDNRTGPAVGVRAGESSKMGVLCYSGGLGGLLLLKPSPHDPTSPDTQPRVGEPKGEDA